MRLVATIEDPAVISKILRHLGLSPEVPEPLPARSPSEPASGSDDLGFRVPAFAPLRLSTRCGTPSASALPFDQVFQAIE